MALWQEDVGEQKAMRAKAHTRVVPASSGSVSDLGSPMERQVGRLLGYLRLHIALLGAVILGATCAGAGAYMWTDEAGVVHFSDTPAPGARKVQGGRISTVHSEGARLDRMEGDIPFTWRQGAMIVKGAVNGAPARFIVDTGASIVVIPPAVAEAAGIATEQASRLLLQTAGGVVQAPQVRIRRLVIGPVERRDVAAVVQPIGNDPALGLLGMSVLGAYHVEVDRTRQVLRLRLR